MVNKQIIDHKDWKFNFEIDTITIFISTFESKCLAHLFNFFALCIYYKQKYANILSIDSKICYTKSMHLITPCQRLGNGLQHIFQISSNDVKMYINV